MAHKTLINGTAYDISGGKTLVGGTAYSIKSGKTLVGGTAYDVSFRNPATITITGTGIISMVSSGSYVLAYVEFNGQRYKNTTLEVETGDVITLGVKSALGMGTSYIKVNGTTVGKSSSSTYATYNYTVQSDISIVLSCNGTSLTSTITLTET